MEDQAPEVKEPVAPASTPTAPSKPIYKNKFFYLFALAFLLIAFLMGGFFLGKSANKQTSAPTATPTQTVESTPTPQAAVSPTTKPANLKTYNEPSGIYSLQYQDDWTYVEKTDEVTFYPSGYPFKSPGEPDPAGPYIKFTVYPGVIGRDIAPIKTEKIIIAGKEVTRFYESSTQGIIETFATPNGKGISISFQLPPNSADQAAVKSSFDQVLSTFKFN